MFDNIAFPLKLDFVRSARPDLLLTAIKDWLIRENPMCLTHPHGFYVVLLHRTKTEEWRFHFWPAGHRPITGMPAFTHTHNYHLDSRVPQGQITKVLYDIEPTLTDGRPLYKAVYTGDRYVSTTDNFLQKTNARVQPLARRSDTFRTDDMYHIERGGYHKASVPSDRPTSTLVRLHSRSSRSVMVVGLDGYPETLSFRRTQCSALTFAEQLSPDITRD